MRGGGSFHTEATVGKTERHETQFRGVWIPAEIIAKFRDGDLTSFEMVLLAIIDSLATSKHGCFASNKYLAKIVGRSQKHVRLSIARLKRLGILKQVGFDGRKRYLETTWVPGRAPVDGRSERPQTGRPLQYSKVYTLSGPSPDDGRSFGLIPNTSGTASKFDMDCAIILLEACQRYLGASHKYLKRVKPSVWADHFRLLREVDEVGEPEVVKVLEWYNANMGGEFTPQAYSGESFRRKFIAISHQAKRDIVATVEVGEDAARIAARLQGLGWPKGSGEAVGAAVQVGLTAYLAWVHRRTAFTEKLRKDDIVDDLGRERMRLHGLGTHIARAMPSPSHFIREWMENVHKHVSGWDAWSGDLGSMAFKPTRKRFRKMGRAWAQSFANDPDRWDRFCEVMDEND